MRLREPHKGVLLFIEIELVKFHVFFCAACTSSGCVQSYLGPFILIQHWHPKTITVFSEDLYINLSLT
jgi:hypothetical protein